MLLITLHLTTKLKILLITVGTMKFYFSFNIILYSYPTKRFLFYQEIFLIQNKKDQSLHRLPSNVAYNEL